MSRGVGIVGALAVSCLSGCSMVGMSPGIRADPPGTFPQCSDGVSTVIGDTAAALVLALITASINGSGASRQQVVTTGGASALFAGSAIYGTVVASRCKAARAAAEKTIPPPPSPPHAAAAADPRWFAPPSPRLEAPLR